MNRKLRHLLYELFIMMVNGLALAFIIPPLINAHESMALLAAGMLFLGFLGWIAFFLYRLERLTKK